MDHTPFISSTMSPRKSTTPSLSITISLSTEALQPHSRNTQLTRSAHAASGVAWYESRKSCTVDSSAVAGFRRAPRREERIFDISTPIVDDLVDLLNSALSSEMDTS